MQPVISALADAFEKMRLPLRSIENEWGPGQLECTFAARPALEAADHAMLFRTATRQICRRMGYFASFMCRPGDQELLCERLASASVRGRRQERAQPVHAGARGGLPVAARPATISAG